MDRLHAEEAFSLFAGTAPTPQKLGRPVSMQVLGWIGGIPDPVSGPLQAISGGTWYALPPFLSAVVSHWMSDSAGSVTSRASCSRPPTGRPGQSR
jgi:hypothetical protein